MQARTLDDPNTCETDKKASCDDEDFASSTKAEQTCLIAAAEVIHGYEPPNKRNCYHRKEVR